MHLPLLRRQLATRQAEAIGDSSSSDLILAILAILAVVFVATLFASYLFLRRLRKQNRKPTYIPTAFLKQKWQSWSPTSSKYGHVSRYDRSEDRARALSSQRTSYNPSGDAAAEEGAAASAAAAGVDRNTSVRSVMTLPAYSQVPKESEQVIGREGERAGMDTVDEFPETADNEEARREEQMESLYQIRLTRRQEIAERELHRQERREARARGDWATLERLRQESRARAEAANLTAASSSNANLSAAVMLAEHQSRGRTRRVSAVTYASVGHVRHDGSRLRAHSEDSEQGGLLDGAAPMGEGLEPSATHSTATSLYTLQTPQTRGRSASSALSISTAASDLEANQNVQLTPPSTRDGDNRSNQDPRSSHGSDPPGTGTSSSSPVASRLTPDISVGSDDIGDAHTSAPVPGAEPPIYDQLDWGEAPAYESPIRDRGYTPASALDILVTQPVGASASNPQPEPRSRRVPSSRTPRLPPINTLPSISVENATEPNTPR